MSTTQLTDQQLEFLWEQKKEKYIEENNAQTVYDKTKNSISNYFKGTTVPELEQMNRTFSTMTDFIFKSAEKFGIEHKKYFENKTLNATEFNKVRNNIDQEIIEKISSKDFKEKEIDKLKVEFFKENKEKTKDLDYYKKRNFAISKIEELGGKEKVAQMLVDHFKEKYEFVRFEFSPKKSRELIGITLGKFKKYSEKYGKEATPIINEMKEKLEEFQNKFPFMVWYHQDTSNKRICAVFYN